MTQTIIWRRPGVGQVWMESGKMGDICNPVNKQTKIQTKKPDITKMISTVSYASTS